MNTVLTMIKTIRNRALGSIIVVLTDHEQRITTLEGIINPPPGGNPAGQG